MFERYYRELLNFLSGHVNDREVAADLTQESYARVLALRQSGQPITDPRALLYRTARNLVIDHHRRIQVRRHEDLDALPEIEHPSVAPHLQPEQALLSQQLVDNYAAVIEALPPRCREAFILYIFDELTQIQIASRMGISVSMVEKHIVRGMLACKLCRLRL